ncbi:serine/threonine-protein kinase [Nostoc sp. UHCC 0926]|uniref:serine/threonine-protein kinase n=1 Tax=unclassified Nostoc TaxID=2593658 RepID=UPI00236093A4|nr:serine/threonine-protein kinase [Nostoc sp. UHCC 0926]WDD34093.1 serine/threonine-protein kinase [Nostoc sp. UHCC 0926]
MSYCLNPHCPKPENPADVKFCRTCGSKLLLKERYRAIKPIGQGGFGKTFLAVDEDKPSKPRCVIKQFYPQAQGTNTLAKAVELFNQEAVQLDELGKHPQIPELLAYFTQEDRQYLVQEFIDGHNLAQELAHRGAFNEIQIRQLLNDLLSVLQFCHARHVIHRDIKPENIIRESDAYGKGEAQRKLVLVDFGAAKSATGTALNKTGTSIGSPEYVAPEQMRGRAVFASDIYSLGATCINLLTKRSPFDSYDTNNDTWVWQQYLQTPVSNQLSHILNKMLESIPIRRYQTVDEVLNDLNHQSQVAAKPAIAPKPIPQSLPNSPTTFVSPSPSQIDNELEEMKTQFLGGGKPQPNKIQPTNPTSQPTSKSKLDEELEELKAKYLGKNNTPNQ